MGLHTPNARGPAADYQVRLYGDGEHAVTTVHGKVIADGATPDYGAIADAKFRIKTESFYDPSSLPTKDLADLATMDMDKRLLKYAAVLDNPNNPVKVLEIATNDPAAAAFIEGRMRALDIPGYVRLEP